MECSPAHGSLEFARNSQANAVKNGRKLIFGEKDETDRKEQPEPSELKAVCQQSEGDIIEITQSAKKRRQAMVNLINEGTVRPDLYLDIFKSKYSQIGKKRLRASNDLNFYAIRKDD